MTYKFVEMTYKDGWTTEKYYLEKIFENLIKLSDDYVFIVARTNTEAETQELLNTIENDKKNILIRLSDEGGTIPSYEKSMHLIFRTYNRKDLYDNKKIFPIPCGYGTTYSYPHNNSKFIEEYENKKLSEREYDIFYSGQISTNRVSMMFNLDKVKHHFKSIVNYTNGFAQGFPLIDYYNYMRNTKICIVPNGAVIPESFRYFEAFASNCVVITSYPKDNEMYNHWYYESSPAIFLKDWRQLTIDLVNDILQNLDNYEFKNSEYFSTKISPTAVAKYILKIIEENDQN